jgi:hypothetical protein
VKSSGSRPTIAAALKAAAHARPEGKAAVALAALLLVGLHPVTTFSLAASFDGLLHLYRLIELDHLIGQGVWFPRWAPDFVFGFGYPIFNFYAPLAYYLSLPLHWVGLSFASSATVFFVACTFVAAVAMCALARSLLDNNWHAGIAAAVTYVYAPTHVYDNLYRSAWATVLAYALVPFILWALVRWYQSGRLRYLNALALGIAALMLSHNVTALLVLPVTGMATLAFYPLTITSASAGVTRRVVHPIVAAWFAVVAGLALSAFFWVPALAETQYVQTWRLTIPPDFDFHTHFLSPAEWIAWPAPAEVGRINPDLVNTIGPVHAILAAAGLLGILVLSRKAPPRVIPLAFFGLVLAAALGMTIPFSTPIWERASLLASLQFPHRFLELAAPAVAILAAVAIATLPVRLQLGTGLVACAALVIAAVPFLYPRPQPPIDPNPTLADMLAHEHMTGALGTTASGEYFPIAVQFIPRSSAFEDAIAIGSNPQRFESRSLPPGARIVAQQAGPLSYELQIETPRLFTATFRHFYFPGWQGYVDGQPVSTTPSQGQGLSTFEVPAGTHQIALAFGSTPARDAATLISIGACGIAALWLAIRWPRRTGRKAKTIRAESQAPALNAHIAPYVWLGLALAVFKVGLADRVDTPLRTTFDGVHVPTVQYARQIRLGDSMTWLGYDLLQGSVTAGEPLFLTLYWQADQVVGTVFSSFAHVVDEQANLYAQQDNLHPGGAPTTTWRAREYDVDRHLIAIPAGTPPGEYWVEAGLYDPRNGARLQRDSAGPGEPLDRLLIGPIHVLKSAQPASISALQINQPRDAAWAGGLRLLGFTTERDRLPADDFLRVALFWQADSAPLLAASMSLRLVDEQGRTVVMQHSRPSNDRYPTLLWSAGERVRDNRALWAPAALPSGSYHLQLNVDLDDQWLDLGTIRK